MAGDSIILRKSWCGKINYDIVGGSLFDAKIEENFHFTKKQGFTLLWKDQVYNMMTHGRKVKN